MDGALLSLDTTKCRDRRDHTSRVAEKDLFLSEVLATFVAKMPLLIHRDFGNSFWAFAFEIRDCKLRDLNLYFRNAGSRFIISSMTALSFADLDSACTS
jgi:hypothetical protein